MYWCGWLFACLPTWTDTKAKKQQSFHMCLSLFQSKMLCHTYGLIYSFILFHPNKILDHEWLFLISQRFIIAQLNKHIYFNQYTFCEYFHIKCNHDYDLLLLFFEQSINLNITFFTSWLHFFSSKRKKMISVKMYAVFHSQHKECYIVSKYDMNWNIDCWGAIKKRHQLWAHNQNKHYTICFF